MQVFAGKVPLRLFTKLVVIGFLAGLGTITAAAQPTQIRLTIVRLDLPRVSIEIDARPGRVWSFRNTYGRIVDLSSRIENVRGIDSQGSSVQLSRGAPGEFRSSQEVTGISYDVNLGSARWADLSHVSWLDAEHGLLMLGDLLPQQITENTYLTLNLPAGWISASSINPVASGRYQVASPEKAIFAIGKSLRQRSVRLGSAGIRLVTTGEWTFKDEEVIKVVEKVLGENAKIFQHQLPTDAALLLMPLPRVSGSDNWTAETRGSTVVLMLGNGSSRRQAVGRLKVVLAHELFHLWVPNALNLKGDYDWFFEGFTLYQALLTALRLHYIRFEDYLETLGRVYDSYRSSSERGRLSLLEASERRWTTSSSFVYDSGMLVAFIYDLMLRRGSGSRATLTDFYPQLWQAAGGQQEANELLMTMLDRRPGMERFSERFVRSNDEIDLKSFLAPFGLEVKSDSITRIKVSDSLNSEQRRVLRTLGFK